ncbi:MAG: molecular chaperone TorD family protein [Deltaproteobacteria bacterium]|nr:molecular chaperone TorD family protein [Deltaproteobacteria bacterium]
MRGDCYRFLAACFYVPQKELFVQENLLENLTASLKKVCPEAAPFPLKMIDALTKYSNEDLSVEYAKLFVGPFELKAPPYGSVYLDKGGRVMGDSTMEVIKAYQEQGLSIDDEFKEVPDHISVELEFMYYLIHKEVEALKKGDKKKALKWIEPQEAFFSTFLRPWVPAFCAKIKEETNNEFYGALSGCVLTFVDNCHGSRQAVLEALEEQTPHSVR